MTTTERIARFRVIHPGMRLYRDRRRRRTVDLLMVAMVEGGTLDSPNGGLTAANSCGAGAPRWASCLGNAEKHQQVTRRERQAYPTVGWSGAESGIISGHNRDRGVRCARSRFRV